jgi:hypothetical protein
MQIEFGVCDPNGFAEIVIGDGRVKNSVAVVFQEGRFAASWDAGSSVKEEGFHYC